MYKNVEFAKNLPISIYRFPKLKKTNNSNYSLADFFKDWEKSNNSLISNLREVDKSSNYITVEKYQTVVNNFIINTEQTLNFLKYFTNNQEKILTEFMDMINSILNIFSNKQEVEKLIATENDIIKKSYIKPVISIQLIYYKEVKKELEISKKSKWRYVSNFPGLKLISLVSRLRNLNRLNKASISSNILIVRLFEMFDRKKIKKEIAQAYDELAEVGLLEKPQIFKKNDTFASSLEVYNALGSIERLSPAESQRKAKELEDYRKKHGLQALNEKLLKDFGLN